MWEIKGINENGKESLLEGGFETKEEAQDYLAKEFKDKEDVFVREGAKPKSATKVKETPVYFEEKLGEWIWLKSEKTHDYFSYGMIMEVTENFVKVQTRQDMETLSEMASFTKTTVENWLLVGRGYIRKEGNFVTLSDFI